MTIGLCMCFSCLINFVLVFNKLCRPVTFQHFRPEKRSGQTEPSHLDLHCLLIHFAFFSISIFARFFFQDLSDTPIKHNGLFCNLKLKSILQKLRGERVNYIVLMLSSVQT